MKIHSKYVILSILGCLAFLLAGPWVQAELPNSPAAQITTASDDQWVLVANFKRGSVGIVNPRNHTVRNVLLGALGDKDGGILDIAVTPDGTRALVSNFGESRVFIVDITDIARPFVRRGIRVPIFAEDIAVTANGRYAVVTDGGLSSTIVVIDIRFEKIASIYDQGASDSQAVAVSPNGTVITADYLNGAIDVFTINEKGVLKNTQNFPISYQGIRSWPVNVAIAPDGQTVLVCTAFENYMAVFKIVAQGQLKSMGILANLIGPQQSVTFDPAGKVAYVAAQKAGATPRAAVAFLDILSPGSVTPRKGVKMLPAVYGGQFFGVDVIGYANNKLFLGNQTSFNTTNYLTVVDLSDLSISIIRSMYPTGVAVVQ